jgi:hypothetical protein
MGQIYNYTLPAFFGGINLIDPIDQTPDSDAQELENVYPSGSKLELRKGLEQSWIASAQAVKTLANLVLADGSEKLVSASNGNLYIQNGTSSTAVKGATTPTLDEWQYTVFNNRLYFCNGTDNAQVYTGTGNFADISFTGGSTPAINTLINVTSYKERLYFIKKNTGSIWYGGAKAVGTTALTEFDVSYFLKLGGYLVSCGSWSSNIGTTTQDLFYILSSEGELLFYSGLDPSAFTLAARYVIGKPLGYRAHVHVENDLWFITNEGIIPVSLLFQTESSTAANSISRKVNQLIRQAAKISSFSYLYSAAYYKAERKVFINLPVTATNTKQLVLNLETNSWTIYKYATSGSCLSMAMSGGNLYTGANNGTVFKSETGFDDDSLPIAYKIRGSFNFFGKRGQYKVFRDVRPIIKTTASQFVIQLDIDTDFRESSSYATITTSDLEAATSASWDTSDWDADDWGDEDSFLFERYSLSGQGHCGALRIAGSISGAPLEFNAFEIRFEEGGQT